MPATIINGWMALIITSSGNIMVLESCPLPTYIVLYLHACIILYSRNSSLSPQMVVNKVPSMSFMDVPELIIYINTIKITSQPTLAMI